MFGWIGSPVKTAARWLGTICLLFLCVPRLSLPAELPNPRIVDFSPQGTVKQVRQVRARFAEPMVPLGDPRGSVAPFDIECPEAGTGRWVASKEWVYDFARDLPAGLRCTFRMRPGLTTLGGTAIESQPEFRFSTGGPAVKAVVPSEGARAIDEEQAFLLRLDAEPTEESIRAHVRVGVAGMADSLEVRVLTGEAREQILKAQYSDEAKDPIVIVQAIRPFPNEARVRLVWGKGVASQRGVPTERD
ncbi:MAG TPA: hypothetical protein VF579_07185 [Candidatus Methylomirabilis sp.]